MKTIIFDFGNVLGRCYADLLTAPYVDNPEDKNLVRDTVFHYVHREQLDRGAITEEDAVKIICSKLPERLHREAITVHENWMNTMIPVPKMTKVVYDLKEKGHKLYLLSNISVDFAENYHTIPWMRSLFAQFDGLVFSGPIRMAKPDLEIYQHILNKYNLNAEDCIFIDDCIANVEGAEKAGIEGYFFDGDVEKLRNHLGIPLQS